MARYRRPRRQGVVYGPVTQHEAGSEGSFLGRMLGLLIVLGAVAVLGVGALNFVGGSSGPGVASPSPTLAAELSPSPIVAPSLPVDTPTSPPLPSPSLEPELSPSPDATPFEITVEQGPGTVHFGTGRGSNLSIRDVDTSFEVGQRIFYLAQLSSTTLTDAISIEVGRYDVATDSETAVTELNVNARIPRIHTLRQRVDTATLGGAGIYVMRFMAGDDVLAEGWFELTEPE